MARKTLLAGIMGISMLSGCGGGSSDFSEPLSGDYYYHSLSGVDRFVAPETWMKGEETIPSKILEYRFDSDYIVACREEIVVGSSGSREPSGKFDYWIVSVGTGSVIGPVGWDEFNRKRTELGISDGLSLQKR